MVDFYKNIFSIEITIFGILIAAYLVFVQIVHASYSYKHMAVLYNRLDLIIYLFLSVIVIVFTAVGSFLLSISEHDFFSTINFEVDRLLTNSITGSVVLLAFFISILIGLIVIKNSATKINPENLLIAQRKQINPENLKLYPYSKYGIPQVSEFKIYQDTYALLKNINQFFVAFGRIDLYKNAHLLEGMSESNIKYLREMEHNADTEFAKAEKEFQSLEKRVAKFGKLLDGYISIIVNAISSSDITVIDTACNLLISLSKEFKEYKFKNTEEWAANNQVYENYAQFISELLRTMIEVCDRNNASSLSLNFIRMAKNIQVVIRDEDDLYGSYKILDGLKEIASNAITTGNRPIFIEVVAALEELTGNEFNHLKKSIHGENQILEQHFRILGWIAEKLLTKTEVEDRPYMGGVDGVNEVNLIANAILNFSYRFNSELSETYPLIYFDAVNVLYKRLLKAYSSLGKERQRTRNDLRERLFDCIHAFQGFAIEAIESKNNDGIAIAVINILECYEQAVNIEEYEIVDDIVKLSVVLAIGCAANDMQASLYLAKSPQMALEEKILVAVNKGAIIEQVRNTFMRNPWDFEKVFAYIIHLGIKLKTNFNYNFDPVTGQRYS